MTNPAKPDQLDYPAGWGMHIDRVRVASKRGRDRAAGWGLTVQRRARSARERRESQQRPVGA